MSLQLESTKVFALLRLKMWLLLFSFLTVFANVDCLLLQITFMNPLSLSISGCF